MAGFDDYIANSDSYDYASFTLSNGASDYDLKANQSALFKNIVNARGIIIISNQTTGIRINNTAFPLISVMSTQMPWEFIGYKIVKNAFLSNNSGSDATVQVLLL